MKRTYRLFGTESEPTKEQIPDGFIAVKEIVMATNRDSGQAILHEANDDDIVEMTFDDDSFWMGRSGELPDYFDKLQSRDGKELHLPEGIIDINGYVSTNDYDRGGVRDVFVKIFRFLKPEKVVVPLLVTEAAKLLDERIQREPGLYAVGAKFELSKIDGLIGGGDKPYLLLIHGILSDVEGSLKQMFEKDQEGLWAHLQSYYGDRIIALQHHTLSKSPIENTIDLLAHFPQQVRLHIITHSRGGLVGEFLCHFHAENGVQGFDATWRNALARAYGDQLIEDLEEVVKGKRIVIEKFIRVACPAQGTTLASEHLDVFLNTIINVMRLVWPAASPALNAGKRLLAAVLSCKAMPEVLPGVEATRTESVFIRVLNHPGKTLTAPLTVIAGNAKMGPNLAAFATLLSKVFFKFKMNDWMIDTRYMLRGTPRHKPFAVYIDQGSDVKHTNYFEKARIQHAIIDILKGDSNMLPSGFQWMTTYDANAFDRGVIMGSYTTKEPSGKKPIVFVLPGILGSNLSAQDTEIYLQFLQISVGGMKRLSMANPDVRASSVIASFYKKFCEYLQSDYDVVAFPFDWRKSVKHESAKLAQRIEKYLNDFPDQPISIVAHSMGGLVARHLAIDHEEVWTRLNDRNGFRTLLLGSPLGGSYMIPEVLIGEGKRVKQLASLDITNDTVQLLEVFSGYHGLQDLLPIATVPHDFGKKDVWLEMKNRQHRVDWVLPSDDDLARFASFREEVNQKGHLFYDNANVIYIAGKAEQTPDSFVYRLNHRVGQQLEFVQTDRGDGSVTWASGIPQSFIQSNRLYYVDTSHGDLAKESSLFSPYLELLRSGTTTALSRSEVPPRKRRFFGLLRGDVLPATEENLLRAWMGDNEPAFIVQEQETPIVEITVSNSDLVFADYPLMTGHLMNDIITSAEGVLDNKIGGKLSRSHALGNYPNEIGTSQIFQTNEKVEAVIVGLGENEKLSAYRLEQTISLGVIKYLLEIYNKHSEDPSPPGGIGLSVLFIGTGYAGFSLEASIMAIVSGINKANKAMIAKGIMDIHIAKVELIEIYQDKAIQALLALKRLKKSNHLHFDIEPEKIVVKGGTRKRFVFENNSEWWKRITISSHQSAHSEDISSLRFVSSWASARAEQYNLDVSSKIIEKLLEDLSKNNQWNAPWAKTLFELLIPQDFKSEIQQLQPLLLLVDKKTAQYPWELLQDSNVQGKPIVTQVGMIRQLATTTFKRGLNYASSKRTLIVGDPLLDGYLPQLQGALKEAEAVHKLMVERGYESTAILSKRFIDIVHALYNAEHTILHLAGHGIYNKEEPAKSGMVIGNGVFLSTREIVQLPYVPEVVFVNCCYLGEFDADLEAAYQHRNQLAASIGLELIDKGVKAVVVAGWAVNDNAAKLFAEIFYNSLMDGRTFGESVLAARRECYEQYSYLNTWGAYQCYGDYSYRLETTVTRTGDFNKSYDIEEEIEIDLLNISTQVDRRVRRDQYIKNLKLIHDVMVNRGNTNAYLYELLAENLTYYDEDELAYGSYKRMLKQPDASYSIQAIERFCMLLKRIVLLREQDEEEYIHDLQQVISAIDAVQQMHLSAERHFLLGAAYQTLYIQLKKYDKKEIKQLESAILHFKSGLEMDSSSLENTLGAIANLITIDAVLEEELKANIESLTEEQLQELKDRKKAAKPKKESTYKNLSKQVSSTLSNASKDNTNGLIKVQLALIYLLAEPSQKRLNTLRDTVSKEVESLAIRETLLTEQRHNVLLYLHTLNKTNERWPLLDDYRKYLGTL
jgi:CHAT domain-containing protein/pimeloyl-ACP methyl ester carboxylesterase